MANNSNSFIKMKLQNLKNSYAKMDFNTSNNNFFSTMNNDGNSNIKINFMNNNNSYSNIVMNKVSNNIDSKTEITPVEKDIYYDEIIYYDGGDVQGYGDIE